MVEVLIVVFFIIAGAWVVAAGCWVWFIIKGEIDYAFVAAIWVLSIYIALNVVYLLLKLYEAGV